MVIAHIHFLNPIPTFFSLQSIDMTMELSIHSAPSAVFKIKELTKEKGKRSTYPENFSITQT